MSRKTILFNKVVQTGYSESKFCGKIAMSWLRNHHQFICGRYSFVCFVLFRMNVLYAHIWHVCRYVYAVNYPPSMWSKIFDVLFSQPRTSVGALLYKNLILFITNKNKVNGRILLFLLNEMKWKSTDLSHKLEEQQSCEKHTRQQPIHPSNIYDEKSRNKPNRY